MSKIELSQQQANQIIKLQQEAEQQVFSSSATWLVTGGVAFILFNPISLPLAIVAASPFVWSAINRARRNGVNAEYLHESGNFAHVLNSRQLERMTRILGKDEVIGQLLEAHQEHKPMSGDALDYLETAGYDVENSGVTTLPQITRSALSSTEDCAIDVPAQTVATHAAEMPSSQPTQIQPMSRAIDVLARAPIGESLPVRTLQTNEQWISDFLFDSNGNLRRQHLGISGKSQSGKSTLGSHLMRCIAGDQQPKIWLVNPKHIASEPDWEGITPCCHDINGYLDSLTYFNELLKSRVNDRNFSYKTAEPWFLILEEMDWAVSAHGEKAVLSLVRPLIKVGAALKIVVILVSQSAQADYFTSSDWRQFSRLVIGIEALSFLSNPQFCFSSEVKEPLRTKAELLTKEKERFALAIPFEGLPSIQTVPDLTPIALPSDIEALTFEPVMTTTPDDPINLSFQQSRFEHLFNSPEANPRLSAPQEAIVSYCKKNQGRAIVRNLQGARLPEFAGFNTAEDIRKQMLGLQQMGVGVLEGSTFTLSQQFPTN